MRNPIDDTFKAQILDNVPGIIAFHDLEHNIRWANKAYQKATRLSLKEIEGKKCYSVWGLSKPCRHCPVTTSIETGESAEAELTPQNQDHWPDSQGSWLSKSSPLKDENGKVIGAIETAFEISDWKEAEEALRESKRFLQNVFDAIQDGISVLDRNLTIIDCNRWIEDRYAEHMPLVGKKCYKVYQGLQSPCPWCPSIPALKTGEVHSEVVPYPSAEEPSGWIELSSFPLKDRSGSIVGVIEHVKDITTKKQAEEALVESEKKYRSMMGAMVEPIYICSPDYRVEYMNPAMLRKTGRDATGEKCFKALHGLDEKCSWCMHHKSQQGEHVELEIVSPKDNRSYYISQSPIAHGDGSASNLTILRDITEMRETEAHLQQANKMEAIATLAGGVAHEFNNALMGVMGNIELLKMDLPEDERRDRYFEAMKDSSHRMSRLTDQLLAYAQGGKYQQRNLKLDGFVIQTLQILQHDLSPEVRVETHFSKDVSVIKADNAQMQMVLSAILANSNEGIENEGLIRITAENKYIDEDFAKQHPGFKPGSYVCLNIEDDGKGMDEETKDGIFEPFFTTKFQGRGMGMAAVYGIVKNHDGWIHVDSELGKGTTVQIYLPAISAESKAQGAKAGEQPEVQLAIGEGTILMIEDEDVVIEVTQAMLEWLGYRVMVAKTGKDAIHITETFDGQIDLALLDIKLPDMEGGKLYPLIMEARPNLRVIVFSGYSIEGSARKILDAGAQDFIQKPFSLATLSEKLKEVLAGK